ncbi:MAG TPA: protein-L-isoaspartate O-methyltransferase [Alphaproteobacteria bacterium]|nr:protein-L-isoaspartate O-methyltransferase [Alphaproteobacteria bacterium]
MFDYAAARKNMVEGQLMPSGVLRSDLLARFLSIPREAFVPANLRGHACADSVVSLEDVGFLLPPALHARLIEAAGVTASDRVLEVGAATGYGAAILSGLAGRVTALARELQGLETARVLWESLGCKNVTAAVGPLTEGWEPQAPYSLIVLNGAVHEVPERLVGQLERGGRLVGVIRATENDSGCAVVIRRGADGAWSRREMFDATCPWLPGFEPPRIFRL